MLATEQPARARMRRRTDDLTLVFALVCAVACCGCGGPDKTAAWEPLGPRCFGDPNTRMRATATWSQSALRGASIRVRVALAPGVNRPSLETATLVPYNGKVLSETPSKRDLVVEMQPESSTTRVVGFRIEGLECAQKNADARVEVRVDWTGGTPKEGQKTEAMPLRATVSSPL